MKFNRLVTALLTSFALGVNAPVLAQEKHDHSAGHGHAQEPQHYEKPAFANIKDAWAFMATKIDEAGKLLDGNKIEPLHEIGEQMEGAVHTLEERSDMVGGDAKTKLASALKQLDKAVDDLHHAAEKKDAAAAGLALKKIRSLMPLVAGLYPEGALK